MAVHEISQNSNHSLYLGNESKLFHPFEINDDENYILDYYGDLDPDKCYFNQYSQRLIKSCNYFVEETFNKYVLKHNVSQNSFSIMHLNIRSMPANFTSFLSYLENITHTISVIGLTETWLKQSNVPLYGITEYNHIAITRSHGKGGGVSLLISDVFVYSELTDMCIVSDYIECVFARIMYNEFSWVIGAIYRPPNSNIAMFNEKLNDILSQVSHMSCYIIGDYNIDLIKHGSHSQTEQLLDIMHSNSLIPMFINPQERQVLLRLLLTTYLPIVAVLIIYYYRAYWSQIYLITMLYFTYRINIFTRMTNFTWSDCAMNEELMSIRIVYVI